MDCAGPFLLEREDAHNLLLGLVSAPLEYRAVVTRDGEVLGAAVASSRGLVLSQVRDLRAVDAVAEDLRVLRAALPGVHGPPPASRRFIDQWPAGGSHRRWAMRVHRADAVSPPVGVLGRLREATGADRDLLVAWCAAFTADTGGLDDADPDVVVNGWLEEAGSTWVWTVRDSVVSMARCGSPTPSSIRVSGVYTPAELRGRGYGRACVATLTQRLFSDGWRFTTLFTDLANPVSNRLYARIGYRPVCDMAITASTVPEVLVVAARCRPLLSLVLAA